ncbi:YicC/YloC family endoribonuclease [Sediminitomix flava]|uniref:Uncharacterized protein (TIGR00255 family) n=1 Tax=Sediminitomix flava TaxID=379075 RepID=A0A315Z8Z7_SEDFL|nr:YicC/YloC family endoribonuclease [Sediminitomix flava]PWJ42035.1 uncharacterized protein (TIGR00255 family) [Sediminitomix flava]
MIKSMTGFGRAQVENEQVSVQVEIKTLNSKNADIIVRMSSVFSSKEIEVRNQISSALKRGKILINVNYTAKDDSISKASINKELVKNYFKELSEVAQELNVASSNDLLKIALEMPDVMNKEVNEDSVESAWKFISEAVGLAISNCDQFRIDEGKALEAAFKDNISKISTYLTKVEERDPQRLIKIREKLNQQIKEIENNENFDPNRFEQELIYYIEKLDIAEEKVRLKNHLEYFIENLSDKNASGKKLGFISQEIGREINTIGSKANDLEIQKLVVNMKEELEKIKEQVLNVL